MATPPPVYVHTEPEDGCFPASIHINLQECHGHEVLVSLDELEAHLQQEQFLGFTHLYLTFSLYDKFKQGKDPTFMEGIGLAIRNSHPNLKELSINNCSGAGDTSLAVLLKKLPPRLSEVRIDGIREDMPQTFQALGRFRQLERVFLGYYLRLIPRWCTPQSFEILADSLEMMPLLHTMDIYTTLFFHPQNCLEPLFTVLGSKENQVMFNCYPTKGLREFVGDPNSLNNQLRVGDLPNGSVVPYAIDQKLWDILGHGPTLVQRLKQAHRRGVFPDSIQYNNSLQAWVEAMIFFNRGEDTFDVFHFLVAQIPPDLLSTACLLKL